jgi:alkanesulfonate monooxygenase SsuD/methylene tetrahydromethanopterin reductase-like flavin-dependent oxidoreductase (luciferase family)
MKFGIVPINKGEFTDPEVLISFAQLAEAVGYESVWTFEHVLIPKTYQSVFPTAPAEN